MTRRQTTDLISLDYEVSISSSDYLKSKVKEFMYERPDFFILLFFKFEITLQGGKKKVYTCLIVCMIIN